ncbi:MAG: hypothetical protein AABX89_00865 [Candidatus Thermoplasmatota archaeon]
MGAWRVAVHEFQRSTAFLDRKTVPLLVFVLVGIALAGPLAASRLDAQAGLYPVGVAAGSPFAQAVASDSRFEVLESSQADLGGRIALWIDDEPHAEAGNRGRAALTALRQATQTWLDAQLAKEADQDAAFPLLVNLLAAPRAPTFGEPSATAAPDSTTPTAPVADPVLEAAPPESRTLDVRPRDVSPPFPVQSLLLTFAFLIPMNLVAQMHAATLLGERTRHRTVLLLSSPLRPWQILAGRTIPYLALGLLSWGAAAVAVGVGWQGAVAALLIVAIVLATSLLLGLLARSPRELTFLLTGATTAISTFLFLPAIFTAIPQVAFLSPVAVISASIEGDPVGWGPFLYATLPLTLVTVALALLALGLMRDETLHGQANLSARLLASLRRLTATRAALFAAGILAVPFAFALQLFLLSLIIPLGLWAAIPGVLLGAALVEEALKQTAVRAHRTGTRPRSALSSALLVGSGFFLGEKIALLIGLVGFGLLPNGASLLAVLGGGSGLLLIAPLVLHIAAAWVGALGVGRGRVWSLTALTAAWALHCAYNLAILAGALA